jgi:hypothetical protein
LTAEQRTDITGEDINIFLSNEKLAAEGVGNNENTDNDYDSLNLNLGCRSFQETKPEVLQLVCIHCWVFSQASAVFHLTVLQARKEIIRS